MTSELNTINDMGMVTIPFNLIVAACSAIDKKRDAPKTLAELRRYTVGDMSSPRAVPDVPELVRYRLHWSDFDTADMEIDSMEGEYVLHSQAAEIIAVKDAEIAALNKLNALVTKQREEANAYGDEGHKRAEAAEAELAQIMTQKPVGSRELRSDGTYGWSQYVYKGWQPLYASPATAPDLKADNERLREALQDIANLYQPRTPIQRAINIARAALKVDAGA